MHPNEHYEEAHHSAELTGIPYEVRLGNHTIHTLFGFLVISTALRAWNSLTNCIFASFFALTWFWTNHSFKYGVNF